MGFLFLFLFKNFFNFFVDSLRFYESLENSHVLNKTYLCCYLIIFCEGLCLLRNINYKILISGPNEMEEMSHIKSQ